MPNPKREPTPSPWSYEYDNSDTGAGQWFKIRGPNGEDLLWWPYNSTIEEAEEHEANARLIAASPDLLEACQKALGIAESWTYDQLDGTRMLDSALKGLESIRAAIAKARGDSDA